MSYEQTLRGRRVLVTGGAGFVGSRTVARLVSLGAKVTVLDDFSTGHLRNLDGVEGFEVVEGSVTDEAATALVSEAELVLHLAARNIIVSTRNPAEDFDTNARGTLNLLLAARSSEIRRFVYASSASVYGNSRYLPANEDDPPNLLSPYSVSKFTGESYCRAFYETYGVPTTSVRYSNVYGPGQSPENPYSGVVAKFMASARSGDALKVHGDGQQTRDFTYVDDAVEATLIAAAAPRAVGSVFNVGTGFETSVNDLARMVSNLSPRDVRIEYVDRRDIDNIRRRVLNIERIRTTLRWVPRLTLQRGLEESWRWLCAREEATPRGDDH